jgi:hypothetical protein
MLFRTDDQIGVGIYTRTTTKVAGDAVVRVGDIAIGAIDLSLERAINIQPHPAVRTAPLYGDVVPLVIQHTGGPAYGTVPRGVAAHAKNQLAARDRKAELAILVESVSVEQDVAKNPIRIRSASHRAGWIVNDARLHPELEGEVLGTHIGRRARVGVGRVVDLDLDAIDIAGPVAKEAQGITDIRRHGRKGGRGSRGGCAGGGGRRRGYGRSGVGGSCRGR